MKPYEESIAQFKKMFKCDTVRISSPLNKTLFLIIGYNRSTTEDAGQWLDKNGKRLDWIYALESCIASGESEEELMDSAQRYKQLLDMKKATLSPFKNKKIMKTAILSLLIALTLSAHASVPKQAFIPAQPEAPCIMVGGEAYKLKSVSPSEIGTQEVYEGAGAFITKIKCTSNPKYAVAGAAKVEGAKLVWSSTDALAFQYKVNGSSVLEIWAFNDKLTIAYTKITEEIPNAEDMNKLILTFKNTFKE